MKNKVIVTGASGFVGSNLVKYLLHKEFQISVIVREDSDLSNLEDIINEIQVFRYDNNLENLIRFFNNSKIDSVFHLASNFIAEHEFNQIDSLIKSNITFGLHLLEAMKETGVKNLINTGTSWQHFNNEEYNPVCLYAATKQAFESLIEYYVQAEDFKVVTLKLFDTYGETDTRPKLINLLNKFADEEKVLKMSPGEQILNLVHVNDVCKAFNSAHELLTKENKACHLKFAVANEKSYNLREVIEIFESVTNKKINIIWGGKPYRKREVMKLWNKKENLPNWKPIIPLEEGFKLLSNIN